MCKSSSTTASDDTQTAWHTEIADAENLFRAGETLLASAHARAAAILAHKLREPSALRRTARLFKSLSQEKAATQLTIMAERVEKALGLGELKEPAALFEYVGIDPAQAAGLVFKYLTADVAPHRLRGLKNKAFIACTSRSGSTLLAASLERYRLNAQEFFNPEEHVRLAAFAGEADSLKDYANRLAATAVSGGWFVCKGAIESFMFLCYLGEFPERAADWHIIFLRRRNLVRQAISMEIAARTQAWNVRQEAQARLTPADYSFESLSKRLDYVFAANGKWERIFVALGVEPHRLWFEDLVADVAGETEKVASFLGLDVGAFPGAKRHAPWPKSQSTAVNTHWEKRIRRDLAARLSGRRPVTY